MKKVILTLWALATVALLTACPDKGGKGDKFVTSPNSCINYHQDPYSGLWYDQYNQQVTCNQGYFGQGYNNWYQPYNQYSGGQYQTGCSSWSQFYPGNVYVPVQVGYTYVCVNVSSFSYAQGYNSSYGYPTYSCQWGVNCGQGCFGGGGISGGVSFGPLWLGGTLGLCY
jgi:hypothetical protein